MSDGGRRRRRARRRWIWIVVVLAASAAVAFAVLRGRDDQDAVTVVVERIELGRFVREVTGSGVIEAVRERGVGFRSGGRVAKVQVEEGDAVEQGQVLITLDSAELERSLASTESSLRSARADRERTLAQLEVDGLDVESAVAEAEDRRLQAISELRDRDADVARTERLLELGAASRDELRLAVDRRDAAQRAVEQAEIALNAARARRDNQRGLAAAQRASADASVARLETDVANLQARIADAVLTAPFAGVVASLSVEEGDTAGSQAVVTIADPNELRVRASFDENRAAELTVGAPADVVPDADTRVRLPARVARLSPVAGREAGSAQVEAILEFGPSAFEGRRPVRPGYTTTVRVRVAELENQLLIPLEALAGEDERDRVVYLVELDEEARDLGVTRSVGVTVLERNATVAAVDPATPGLAAGDAIVVVGVDELEDGTQVRFPELPPP